MTATGMVVVATAAGLLATVSPDEPYLTLAVVLAILGAGMGLVIAPATDIVLGSVPPAKAGVGSAVNDTTRELGAALGVAVIGSAFASGFTDRMLVALDRLGLPASARGAASEQIGAALAIARDLPPALGDQVSSAARTAFTDGMDLAALTAVVVAVAGLIVVIARMPEAMPAGPEEEPDGDVSAQAVEGSRR